ncbi:hypothetical protein HUJ05_012813 [Dendroctonus ponderosae]|nr:hypothetical protein HUJ05_012813 [Dendroctonus ponderosae]
MLESEELKSPVPQVELAEPTQLYIADNIFTCATRRCLALSLEEPLLCAIGTMLLFTWNGSQHLRKICILQLQDLVDIMTMDGKYHLPPDTVVPC